MYAHPGLTGPEEPPEYGEINEMTLSSRHKMQNSRNGGRALYLSITKASYNIESLRVSGEETRCFFETRRQTRDLRLSKQAALPTA